MDDVLRNTLLYDFYADLLTARQRNIYHMYHCEDMSLAEIGDRFGISRQAVSISLKQARRSFDAFEVALKLVERHVCAREYLAELKCALEGRNYTDSVTILDKLDDLI
ncbi:MAG: DNA-binding protein [Clostridiales bacterium]|jgi:predicted DNA-binding protein YlxM (UPF0122 family)|nr:DNA-binding protein [Clostridiales bacterium]